MDPRNDRCKEEHREGEEKVLAEGRPQDAERTGCAEGGPASRRWHQLLTRVPGTGTVEATSSMISEAVIPRICASGRTMIL